jgi:tetratricopeptide (TPR) repeat protein
MSGQYERSHRMNAESLALFRSLGDKEGTAVLLHRIGISTMRFGDHQEVRELLDESLRLFREVGSVSGESELLGAFAYLLEQEGDLAAALELFSRAAEMAAEAGFIWWEIGMLQGLCECSIRLGRVEEAEPVARKELTLAAKIGDRQASFFGLVHAAWIAAQRGEDDRAGLLWGALEAEAGRAPIGQWEKERDEYVELILRETPEFTRAREEGRRLSFERAVEKALGDRGAAAGA